MTTIRRSPFALRVVQRKGGKAGIIYRRRADNGGRDRLQRIASLSPLAFTAGTSLLQQAAAESRKSKVESRKINAETGGPAAGLTTGPFHPLDADWGPRVACYAVISSGLGRAERLLRAASHLRQADPVEASWWLGLLTKEDNLRALRALRILTEAVE